VEEIILNSRAKTYSDPPQDQRIPEFQGGMAVWCMKKGELIDLEAPRKTTPQKKLNGMSNLIIFPAKTPSLV